MSSASGHGPPATPPSYRRPPQRAARLFPSDQVGQRRPQTRCPGWRGVTEPWGLTWQLLRAAYGAEQMGWARAPLQARNMKAVNGAGQGQKGKEHVGQELGPALSSHSGAGLMLGWCRRKIQPALFNSPVLESPASQGHPPSLVVVMAP